MEIDLLSKGGDMRNELVGEELMKEVSTSSDSFVCDRTNRDYSDEDGRNPSVSEENCINKNLI